MKQEYYWFFHSMLCIFSFFSFSQLLLYSTKKILGRFLCVGDINMKVYAEEHIAQPLKYFFSLFFYFISSSFIMKKNRRYYIIFFLVLFAYVFLLIFSSVPSYPNEIFPSFLFHIAVCSKVVCLRLHFIFILLENYLQTYEEK